jgi:hypothetical protein
MLREILIIPGLFLLYIGWTTFFGEHNTIEGAIYWVLGMFVLKQAVPASEEHKQKPAKEQRNMEDKDGMVPMNVGEKSGKLLKPLKKFEKVKPLNQIEENAHKYHFWQQHQEFMRRAQENAHKHQETMHKNQELAREQAERAREQAERARQMSGPKRPF